ncbi:unnamed protein product [Brachionus calyciflorus]|uniref:Uncharacterized protein n=1 Tax=Brachionus calyciflorus TaxID=104777 RepID=A0A814NTB7_9BILA|nr:unnamed protein product [Brachionus calyciflorus]
MNFNHKNEKDKLAREFSEKIEFLKNDYLIKKSSELKRIKDETELEFSNKLNLIEKNLNSKNQQLASAQSEISKEQNELSDKEREITSLKDQHKKDLEEFNSRKPNFSLNDDIQIISNRRIKMPKYENCRKNPRNAGFINLISQLTSANEKLQLEIKNLNISLEVSNSNRTNESLKDNDKYNENFDKFETKERECSELNDELMSREYRIDELENEINSLTEQMQDLQEALEKGIASKLPITEEKMDEPKKVGKYGSNGARKGRDVYKGTLGGYFLYNPGGTKYYITGDERRKIIFN